jgi:hypothetical protein
MFCVEEWVVVPLMGSEVVWCTLRWPVVWFWPLRVLLLVEEKVKEEELVKLEEDIVGFGCGCCGGFGGELGCVALEFQVDSDLCGGRGSWLCFLCALNGLV